MPVGARRLPGVTEQSARRGATDATGATAGTDGTVSTDAGVRPPRPQLVLVSAALFGLTAVGAVITALVLRANRSSFIAYVHDSYVHSKTKLPDDLPHAVDQYLNAQLIESIVLAVMLLLLARVVLLGRHWVRWAALGVYVLASFSTPLGLAAITSVASNAPAYQKVPALLTSLCFLGGLVLLFLRAPAAWLTWGRPAATGRPGLFGSRSGRGIGSNGTRPGGGLFGPRPAPGGTRGATPRGTVVDAEPVSVEPTTSRAEPKARGGAPAPVAGTGRPPARTKGSSKSRRS